MIDVILFSWTDFPHILCCLELSQQRINPHLLHFYQQDKVYDKICNLGFFTNKKITFIRTKIATPWDLVGDKKISTETVSVFPILCWRDHGWSQHSVHPFIWLGAPSHSKLGIYCQPTTSWYQVFWLAGIHQQVFSLAC